MPQGYRDELVLGIRVDNAWITKTVSVICLEFTSPCVITTRPMRTLHPHQNSTGKIKLTIDMKKSRAFFYRIGAAVSAAASEIAARWH